MLALLILQFKSFFKSAGSIFTFVLPLVLLIVLGYSIPAAWIVPSVFSIGILSTALFQFGSSLEEIKRTAFMKSVGLTKLNKFTTFISFLIFTIFVTILGIIWVLFWSWFLTTPVPFLSEDWGNLADIPPILTKLNWENVLWGTVLYSWIINIALSFSMAFFFLSITKSSESYNFLSIGYIFLVLFLGGVILPDFLITAGADEGSTVWIQYAFYLTPHYYINTFSIAAFGGGIVNQLDSFFGLFEKLANIEWSHQDFFQRIIDYPAFQDPWSLETPLSVAKIFAPIGFILLFAGLGTKFFKWG